MFQYNLGFKSLLLPCLFVSEFLDLFKGKKSLHISQTSGFFVLREQKGFLYFTKPGLTSVGLQGKKAEASKALQLVNLILPMQLVCNAI